MIKRVKKNCKHCKQESYLFNKGLCKKCWQKKYGKPIKKVTKPINKLSQRGIERWHKYKKLRDEYFIEHPVCEFPECNSRDIDLHHKSGRLGNNLFKDFCTLCRIHHDWVHLHAREAKELGLLL